MTHDQLSPFARKINLPIKLPVLSKNIPALMQVMADETLDYRGLAHEINNYPEIAARLLYLANSAWSAPDSSIADIESACLRLGSSVVRSVSLAIAIGSAFDTLKCPGFDVHRFWIRCMLVAETATLLVQMGCAQEPTTPKIAHTAGLLHNIGLLWLVDNLATETSQALQMTVENPALSLPEALQLTTGADYAEVGGWLVRKWQFPEILVVAIEQHLHPSDQGHFHEIAKVIAAATKIAAVVQVGESSLPDMHLFTVAQIDLPAQECLLTKIARQRQQIETIAKVLFN